MVKVFDSVARGPIFLVQPKYMFLSLLTSLLHLTSGSDTVDDKDLAVRSDQGNV